MTPTTENKTQKPNLTCCKGLEKQDRKYLQYYKQSFLDTSDGCSGEQDLDKNENSKNWAMTYEMRIRTLLQIRLESIYNTL